MPSGPPTGMVCDTGDFAAHVARTQEIDGWKGFGRRAARSKTASRLRGIGLATSIEARGGNGPDPATVRLDRDGKRTVLAGSPSTTQGHPAVPRTPTRKTVITKS